MLQRVQCCSVCNAAACAMLQRVQCCSVGNAAACAMQLCLLLLPSVLASTNCAFGENRAWTLRARAHRTSAIADGARRAFEQGSWRRRRPGKARQRSAAQGGSGEAGRQPGRQAGRQAEQGRVRVHGGIVVVRDGLQALPRRRVPHAAAVPAKTRSRRTSRIALLCNAFRCISRRGRAADGCQRRTVHCAACVRPQPPRGRPAQQIRPARANA
jgi:hypothetical protein